MTARVVIFRTSEGMRLRGDMSSRAPRCCSWGWSWMSTGASPSSPVLILISWARVTREWWREHRLPAVTRICNETNETMVSRMPEYHTLLNIVYQNSNYDWWRKKHLCTQHYKCHFGTHKEIGTLNLLSKNNWTKVQLFLLMLCIVQNKLFFLNTNRLFNFFLPTVNKRF